MKMHSERHITSAERMDGGIIISFDDGKSAVFSAALLYKNLPEAEEIIASDEDEGEEPAIGE